MISTSDFKKGVKMELDATPYIIIDFQHVKPGKGPAFVRTKLRNLLTGKVIDRTFRSGEKVQEADVETRAMQYLYKDGENFILMDNETFEQLGIPEETVGDDSKWMQEEAIVNVLIYKGVPATIELPAFLELQIVETDPGVKGDTAQGGSKPAKLETGAVVNVPLFVAEGEVIRVDTRTGEYMERVKKS
jgi:elongation factor P